MDVDFTLQFSGFVKNTYYKVDAKVQVVGQTTVRHKRVCVMDRRNFTVLGYTTPAHDGSATLKFPANAQEISGDYVLLVAVDDSGKYNAEVADYVTPSEIEVINQFQENQ